MSSRKKSKVAIFVHGWDATGAVWNQPRQNPNPIGRLFADKGFLVDAIDMPGRYMDQKKDFYYYAEYLAKKVESYALPHSLSPQDHGWADEVNLVCHSMGGVAALLYLREDIGDPEAKSRISQVITLASPLHGTSVSIKQVAHVFMPGLGDITFDALMKRMVICYRQAQLAGPFMQRLHSLPNRTPKVEFHSIWTRGDVVISPNHTAVLDGAYNYYIDLARVGHADIMWKPETLHIIKNILNGKAQPSGLQQYPPANTGDDHLHMWFPASGTDERTPIWSAGEKRFFLWKCENAGCGVSKISINRPSPGGCAIGQLEDKYRWHNWKRTGLKRYRCNRCRLAIRSAVIPSPLDTPQCVKKGKAGRHQWAMQSQQWKCVNESDGRRCNKKAWGRMTPHTLGCPVGIRQTNWHLWRKKEPRFRYMFRCATCNRTAWHPEE